jgi:hypothetical protein
MEKFPPAQDPSPISLDTAVGLSFDYLKQLGTIAMTAAGGLIALAQFVDGDKKFFIKIMIATSLMFISALLAFLSQFSLVQRVRQAHSLLRHSEKEPHPYEKVKKMESLFEGVALWLLSISMGIAVYALFVVGVPA